MAKKNTKRRRRAPQNVNLPQHKTKVSEQFENMANTIDVLFGKAERIVGLRNRIGATSIPTETAVCKAPSGPPGSANRLQGSFLHELERFNDRLNALNAGLDSTLSDIEAAL